MAVGRGRQHVGDSFSEVLAFHDVESVTVLSKAGDWGR